MCTIWMQGKLRLLKQRLFTEQKPCYKHHARCPKLHDLGLSDTVIRVCIWYFHTYFVITAAKCDVQHVVVPSMLPQQQSNTDSLF